MTRQDDRVALVTGAASGIGRAAALAFARAGARVALADVDTEGAQRTLADLQRFERDALVLTTDVSRAEEVRGMIDAVLDRWGRLDAAFNNAGIEGRSAALDELEEEEWDRVLAVNLKSAWLCMREELRVMRPRRRGSIVNCSSIAGLVGFPKAAAYVASKHGMVGLTRTAALEVAEDGIRVNAVCPGVIRTPMIDRYTQGDAAREDELARGEPMGRLGTPEEVAAAAVWLASDDASFVTGVALPVDGGWVAR